MLSPPVLTRPGPNWQCPLQLLGANQHAHALPEAGPCLLVHFHLCLLTLRLSYNIILKLETVKATYL